MIDISTRIVETLTTVLPTYYDLFLDTSCDVPCISYQIMANNTEAQGNLNGWSRIYVRVKLWTNSIADSVNYSAQIDDAMAALGRFQRNTVGNMFDGELICAIFDYSILVEETFTTPRYMPQ